MRILQGAALGDGDRDQAQQVDGTLIGAAARDLALVQADRFRNLFPDRQQRIERRHRVLEDVADAGATDAAHGALGLADQFFAVEPDRAGDASARRQQTHDGHHGHALAGAGFADDAVELPLLDIEVDAADGLQLTASLAGERHFQVADLKQRRAHFDLGSSRSRRPSPRKLKPSTMVRMARPGPAAIHQR